MKRILILSARILGPILLTRLMRGRKRKRVLANEPDFKNQADMMPDHLETEP